MRIVQVLALIGLGTALLASSLQARAQEDEDPSSCYAIDQTPVCIAQSTYTADVCAAIEIYAEHFGLPEGFLARLIWQESRFDPQAISPVGAQGIAQFMPGTARLRALRNPFDPAEALARSAEYLRFLELKFGNLGLAAAAYNGGEGKISRFLTGGSVAGETRAYVSLITGRSIEQWLGDDIAPADFALIPDRSFQDACIDMAKAVPMPDFGPAPGEWRPWGVLLAQNFSPDIARAAFVRAQSRYASLMDDKDLLLITTRNLSMGRRLRYSAQVGFAERAAAEQFCRDLSAAGGNCLVQKNGD
jgi:hypothetical protein